MEPESVRVSVKRNGGRGVEVNHCNYFLLAATTGQTRPLSVGKCEEQGREPTDLGRCRQAGDVLQQECSKSA